MRGARGKAPGLIPGALRRLVVVAFLSLALGPAPAVVAQTAAEGTETPAADQTGAIQRAPAHAAPIGPGIFQPPVNGETSDGGPDYEAWETVAARAEALIADPRLSNQRLDQLRGQLADWREAFLGAQSANTSRIAGIRSQIAALGPAPAEGLTEAEEIAGRRLELTEQLVRLQAPGLKAEEAYQRADGLIQEIDRLRRERQTEALLRLWPTPVNPANWPAALSGLSQAVATIGSETGSRLADPGARGRLIDALPLVLTLLAAALAILARGRRWSGAVLGRLSLPSNPHAGRLLALVRSLAEVIVPVLGLLALSRALEQSAMLGPLGRDLAGLLPVLGVLIWGAVWLGNRIFAGSSPLARVVPLTDEARAEGQRLALATGLLLGLSRLRGALVQGLDLGEAAASVLIFPILLFGGVILWRFGRLLRGLVLAAAADEDDGTAMRRVLGLMGRALLVIGLVGPTLAAVGYNTAAASLIQPAALSLALVGLVALAQQVLQDLWALVTGQEPDDTGALVPVLLGFLLALGSLPVLALIWGADTADLTELWARFQGGFTLGETRISPTDFLLFIVIFLTGLTLTRLVQGVLRIQILPRTGMDQGGRNALAVGFGYAGIFLSALVAINATGIDLSGLAIVAGALSVGIGFGLQAIVSNFVSGIILLIERPVSEGDWIEVGTVQGIVKSISVRSTRIQTFDRSDVIVPNQDLITGRVTNWTRFNLSGRVLIPLTVPFTTDSRRVAAILREVAEAHPMVARSPVPQVALMGFAAEAMNFELRIIVKDVNNAVQVRSDINHEILRRFQAEGIAFTNAHRDYLVRQAEEAEAAAELAATEADLAQWLGGAGQGPTPAGAAPGPAEASAPPAAAPRRPRSKPKGSHA